MTNNGDIDLAAISSCAYRQQMLLRKSCIKFSKSFLSQFPEFLPSRGLGAGQFQLALDAISKASLSKAGIVLISGASGVGKTVAASTLCRRFELLRSGNQVWVSSAEALVGECPANGLIGAGDLWCIDSADFLLQSKYMILFLGLIDRCIERGISVILTACQFPPLEMSRLFPEVVHNESLIYLPLRSPTLQEKSELLAVMLEAEKNGNVDLSINLNDLESPREIEREVVMRRSLG